MQHPSSSSVSTETAKDTKHIHGSCLCGAVQFTLSGSPLMAVLCHCISCRKTSGSSFQANNIYKTSVRSFSISSPTPTLTSSQQFTITSAPSGKDKVKIYADTSSKSGSTINRSFCTDCGSRLWNQFSNPGYTAEIIAVASGALDLGDEELLAWKPEREYYCARKGSWLGSAGASVEAQFQEMS